MGTYILMVGGLWGRKHAETVDTEYCSAIKVANRD